MDENMGKLAKKITCISQEMGKVQADGENKFDHYNYISYEQINARLRNILNEKGLAIIPSVCSATERDITSSGGKSAIRSIVEMKFMLVDTETGYSEERSFFGADQDTKGKSMGQAITECQKRFELKLFHISTQADIDPDSKSTEGAFKSKMPPKKQGPPQRESPDDETWGILKDEATDFPDIIKEAVLRLAFKTPLATIKEGKSVIDMIEVIKEERKHYGK